MQGMENVNFPQSNQFSGPNLDPGNPEDENEMLFVPLLHLVKFQLKQVMLTITGRLQHVPGPFPGIKPPRCGIDNPAPSGTEIKESVELHLYPSLSTFFLWVCIGRRGLDSRQGYFSCPTGSDWFGSP